MYTNDENYEIVFNSYNGFCDGSYFGFVCSNFFVIMTLILTFLLTSCILRNHVWYKHVAIIGQNSLPLPSEVCRRGNTRLISYKVLFVICVGSSCASSALLVSLSRRPLRLKQDPYVGYVNCVYTYMNIYISLEHSTNTRATQTDILDTN